MNRLLKLFALCAGTLAAAFCNAADGEKDVPWRAQAEVARRGALVEHVAGTEAEGDPTTAIAAAMQPPADDSHKWLFTLVVTRNCQWCERARRDFETDAKLKAWVDTKDFAKSWGHWQVVQIEDQSQAWRWKDFRPTAFPTLIVQPPVNGSWGDAHTVVFARQGYLKPADLDAAIRQAIQSYAAKMFPRRLEWDAKAVAAAQSTLTGGLQQSSADRTAGYNPPAPAPAPLPPLPSVPQPAYPSVPPRDLVQQPGVAALLAQLLASLFGGPAVANVLLLAILAWHVYRGIAKREGIPLLLDDATAAEITEFLRSIRPGTNNRTPPSEQR
jgi:hypothetical protein